MTNEIKGGGQSQAFDYKQVDEQMAEFLRRKETNIREIERRTVTDIGRELKEAQIALSGSNQYDGLFGMWIDYIGYKRSTAYELIQRFDELVRISDDRTKEVFEKLPLTLSKAISKKSSEDTEAKAQAKAEVLAGEIDTLKAYKERIKELEKQNEHLARKADKPPEVKTEYVEIPVRDETVDQRLKAYEERFGAIENYSDRPRATNLAEITTSVMSFSKAVRDLAKRHAYLIQYQSTIEALDATTKREYNEAVQALYELTKDFNAVSEDPTIVEAEYEII